MQFLKRLLYKNRKFYDDDFDWDNYTEDSYARRVKGDVETHYATSMDPAKAQIDTEAGVLRHDGPPSHPNHQLILDAIVQLAPGSVHEVGCGGGDHVGNIKALFPDIVVTGGDRSSSQLRFALTRHPELSEAVGVQDITMPFSQHWPTADLVYSQAVVMHIHTAVSHLVALSNMVRQAERFVLLVENTQCHNFVADIRKLAEGGHLAWDAVHIYQFRGSTGAKAILLARAPLDMPELASDAGIRSGEKPSNRRLKRADEDSARGLFGFGSV